MNKLSVCLLFFLLAFNIFSFSASGAYAHEAYVFPVVSEGQINEALQNTVPLRFLPGNVFYILIRIKENIDRFFQPSSAKKASFDQILASKRIKETYLLIGKNDKKRASKNLVNYSKRLDKMVSQLEKARGQKQDVVKQVMEIAEGLKNQETLLLATHQKWDLAEDDFGFEQNYKRAIESFTRAALALNEVAPGIKDRFKTATISAGVKEASPSPEPADSLFSASPSAQPRRIIY